MDINYMCGFQEYKGNLIHPTAIIDDCVELGVGNIIGAYAIIGANGNIRDTNHFEFKGKIKIGDNNKIGEFSIITRSVKGLTQIGSENLIMHNVSIGHDSKIGNNNEIGIGSIVGGYAKIGNNCKIKLNVTIRNRIEIKDNVLIGMGANVIKSVNKGVKIWGNPAKSS